MTIYTLMPLHKCLGLAIIGVDLSEPIDAETSENLSRLLAEHLVLVFPDQFLTPDRYVAAARAFGQPMRRHSGQNQVSGYPDIGLVRGTTGPDLVETWHTEHTSRERPPAATLLYGVEISPSGGDISIADMRAAYWTLPEEERRRLETLRTLNGADPNSSDLEKYDAPVAHPMVRTHPVSRERSVYFHSTQTLYIEGMTPQASQEYLADLVERVIQPEIVYRHSWVKGDVLVIDQRATLHCAHNDYNHDETRLLWRINIEGDRPTLV